MADQERDPASGAQERETEQEQWTDNPQPGGPSRGRTEPHETAAPADPDAE